MATHKPLTARQNLASELRAYQRMEEADTKAADKALLKIGMDQDRELKRINKAITTLERQRDAVTRRCTKAGLAVMKELSTKNKGREQRMSILQGRLSAL